MPVLLYYIMKTWPKHKVTNSLITASANRNCHLKHYGDISQPGTTAAGSPASYHTLLLFLSTTVSFPYFLFFFPLSLCSLLILATPTLESLVSLFAFLPFINPQSHASYRRPFSTCLIFMNSFLSFA